MKKVKIKITKRSDDFHACIDGQSGKWDCGKDPSTAIGNLIRTWPDEFNIELDFGK